PPNEQQRQYVLQQYTRRRQTVEPIVDEAATNEFWFYLSYAGNDADENIELFYSDLSAEIRRLVGLRDRTVGFFTRRLPEPIEEELQRTERALKNSRVLVPLYSPAYFKSEY